MRPLCPALVLAWLSPASCLKVVDPDAVHPKHASVAQHKVGPNAVHHPHASVAQHKNGPTAVHHPHANVAQHKHGSNAVHHPPANVSQHEVDNDAVQPTHANVVQHTVDKDAIRPKYARVGESEVETVWQRPRGDVKGLFFIAHGCNHQATDLFSDVGPDGWKFESCRTSNFKSCLGLPEEVDMRKVALARGPFAWQGYLVMATSGGTGKQSCFELARDPPRIREAVKYVMETEGLGQGMRIFATGASSGGSLMGALAGPLSQGGLPNLKCIAPQISYIETSGHRGVPTIFVHMPRDAHRARTIQGQMRLLKSKEVHTTELLVQPNPVNEKLLLKCVTNATAQRVIATLRRNNFTDPAGYLYEDARRTNWADSVGKVLGNTSHDTLRRDESCISEVMNVAWAQHEFTSEYSEEIINFCEKKFSMVRNHY